MSLRQVVCVGDRAVGPGEAAYIVGEAGVNHNGRPELARRLVEAAARAGVDAVKFQIFRAGRVIARHAKKAPYQYATTGADESQLELVQRLELPEQTYRELHQLARSLGIDFLSTPFDLPSLELLCELDAPAIKVGSGDLNNTPFLAEVARTGRPVILSTGMGTLEEVRQAVAALEEKGCEELVLLHCATGYPIADGEANLRAIRTLRQEFRVPTGFSDHTVGVPIAVAAAGIGADLIEKHFTLDRGLPGPDHQASLEPDELTDLVAQVRRVGHALGDGRKEPSESERQIAAVARRSIVAACALPAGTRLSDAVLAAKRPGTGIPTTELSKVVGRRLRQDVEADQMLTWEMLDP
ncbi:MAG: N-acetylneuraminate synthase [Armatimonadota bacterium]|nr:MAG: N-acetylneuraminate synthase [Armatimonadota bacterium]